MANAYCLWRRSKSPMQSNLPPPLPPPPPQSHSPSSYICSAELPTMCSTQLHCYPFAASVNSFCHALNSAKHHTPSALLQRLCLSVQLYLYFSISLISHSLASNDIYAILIEYLLYMRLHIQAFSLPLPSTIPFASLQCL